MAPAEDDPTVRLEDESAPEELEGDELAERLDEDDPLVVDVATGTATMAPTLIRYRTQF